MVTDRGMFFAAARQNAGVTGGETVFQVFAVSVNRSDKFADFTNGWQTMPSPLGRGFFDAVTYTSRAFQGQAE
jgi:hypothetical protein